MPNDRSVGLSPQEGSAIRAALQQQYAKTLLKLTQFCHATVITFRIALFGFGKGVHSSEVLITALRHPCATALSLPRAVWAVKGWGRLFPLRQRLPFIGLRAMQQFVGLIAKSVSVKGPPLSVPRVHTAKARGQWPS